MTIAFNLAREQLCRERRHPEVELESTAEHRMARQPVEQQRVEFRRDLSRAIEQLSPEQEQVGATE